MMTSVTSWHLLSLTVVLLLTITPTVTEVVNSMADCDEFLLRGTAPNIPGILLNGNILNQNRYKPICQTFEDEKRFVTLYDTKNKIPVFSAYVYGGDSGIDRPSPPWKIEPQLENPLGDKNMEKEDGEQSYDYQARNIDYYNKPNIWHKGHMFPVRPASSLDDKISTFTLTNAVPQASKCNIGKWSRFEKDIRSLIDANCNNNNVIKGFVVTGPIPGNNLLNTVNIPSHLWSAFCCYNTKTRQWHAKGYWAENIQVNCKADNLTLAQLSERLSPPGSSYEFFPNSNCPLNTKA